MVSNNASWRHYCKQERKRRSTTQKEARKSKEVIPQPASFSFFWHLRLLIRTRRSRIEHRCNSNQQQPTATNKQQSRQRERKTHKTLTLFAINRPFGRSSSSRSHWMRQTSLAEVGRWLHKGALVTAGDAVVGGGGVAVSACGRCHILRLGLVGGVVEREWYKARKRGKIRERRNFLAGQRLRLSSYIRPRGREGEERDPDGC